MDSNPIVASSVEPKVVYNYNTYNTYNDNLMNNHKYMVDLTDPFVKRTYESGKWFQIVCNPFDRQYEKYKSWYESDKFIKSVISSLSKYAKKFDVLTDMFLVKEQYGCKKHHVNVLICSNFDFYAKLNNVNSNKFKWYVAPLDNIGERTRVRDYMIKESEFRNLLCPEDFDYTFISDLTIPDNYKTVRV